jgi:hypothetical protein
MVDGVTKSPTQIDPFALVQVTKKDTELQRVSEVQQGSMNPVATLVVGNVVGH